MKTISLSFPASFPQIAPIRIQTDTCRLVSVLFIQNEMEEFAALLGTLASAKEAKRHQKTQHLHIFGNVCMRVCHSDTL